MPLPQKTSPNNCSTDTPKQNAENSERDSSAAWFAMSAPYRRELKAKAFLEGRGIECFVPMTRVIVEKRGGTKTRQLVPAIHNLIFVHTSKTIIQEAKTRCEFLQYRTKPHNGKNVPIIVPDKEMQQFIAVTQALSEKLLYLNLDEIDLEKGTRIRIHGGVLDGTEGLFVKLKGKRRRSVIIQIEGVAAVALTEVSPDLIEVIG